MGRWTYYSPIALGVLLVLSMHGTVAAQFPRALGWAYWPVVAGVAVGVGVVFELVLVGLQGVFAQALPVPRGRTVRGSAAVLTGWLLLGSVGLGGAAVLLVLEGIGLAGTVLAVLAGLAAVGAVATYAWSLPAAAQDFREER